MSKSFRCSNCGYSGSDFKKIRDNIYQCLYCNGMVDFGFSNKEKELLADGD